MSAVRGKAAAPPPCLAECHRCGKEFDAGAAGYVGFLPLGAKVAGAPKTFAAVCGSCLTDSEVANLGERKALK